jgi:cellulose synthase operon protein C
LREQARLGTELSLRYESRHLVADVGSTPLGFPVRSLLGGLLLRGSVGPLSLSVQGGRRSVIESVLSWSGARDPTTGRIWGGVVSEGGRVDLGANAGFVSLYGYGGYDRLVGVDVAQNRRFSAGAGAQATLLDGGFGTIRAGPTGAVLAFDRNLRFFTFGQGGYFSPQRFFHGGVNLGWRREGTVRWEAVVEPGYDEYAAAVSPVFPLNRNSATAPGAARAGTSFNGHLALGVKLASHLETALSGSIQRAPEYQELSAGLVLRLTAP